MLFRCVFPQIQTVSYTNVTLNLQGFPQQTTLSRSGQEHTEGYTSLKLPSCCAMHRTAWLLGNNIDISSKRHGNRSHKKNMNAWQVGTGSMWPCTQCINYISVGTLWKYTFEPKYRSIRQISLSLCVPMSISSHCNFRSAYVTLEQLPAEDNPNICKYISILDQQKVKLPTTSSLHGLKSWSWINSMGLYLLF